MAIETIDLVGNVVPGALAPLADQFRRPITYLRISVTDRCNLRCVYCMPEEGLPWIPKPEILTYEEIEHVVRAAAAIGVRSIRLTGGEPLVRRDLPRLVALLNAIPGIEDIALSTNGILLEQQLPALLAAGLRRANISLDTLREDRFKINCVVMRGKNDDEILDMAELTRERAIFVRFIEVMPVEDNLDLQRDSYVSADEMLARIRENGELLPVDGPQGNGPARYFAFPGARGAVGVISPLSHDYCERCNRVRLTADGRLRLCLFGDHHIDLRTPVRSGASMEDLVEIFRGSMLIKPERHHLRLGEQSSRMRAFSEIGG
jgi:cyclic pyranopterin phosphate synthase